MIIRYAILLLIYSVTLANFDTLSSISLYARLMPEDPFNDSNDWNNPDYTSFYNNNVPSLKKRILHALGFGNRALYLYMPAFQHLLREVAASREHIYSRGQLVEKMIPASDSLFIIWSSLNSSFHSLARCLQELARQNIIDDSLKILHDKTYLVFNGDVVGLSPYNIETLMVVLYLMNRNPKQVFYIKGNLEDKERWTHSVFAQELRIRGRPYSYEKIPFNDILRNFFGTLPLALYLIPPGQTGNVQEIVRISYVSPEASELQESDFSYFFDLSVEPVISLLNKINVSTEVKPVAKAYMYVQDRSKEYIPSKGLLRISKQNAQQAKWIALSSPNPSFKRLYEFSSDAFVVLETKKDVSQWTLTLYNQDVRELGGFKKALSYYVISGKEIKNDEQLVIQRLDEELSIIKKNNRKLTVACENARHNRKQGLLRYKKNIIQHPTW